MVYFIILVESKIHKLSKADTTTKYIIEKAAPIFNKKGYAATSMADITQATGLTKGAIYGNFENKEAIAVAAFNKSVNDLLKRIAQHQEQSPSPLQKLYLIADFYRNYYDYSKNLGGCPILNVGVNAHQQHTPLLNKVQEVISRTQKNVAKLVDWGKEMGEIRSEVDSSKFARQLYTKIQGAVFMCHTMDDHNYLLDATQEIDQMITNELKK